MEAFAQQILDGVVWGALYGALALCIVLVYRASGIVNFAQGELAMLGAYCCWQFHAWGLTLSLSIVLAIVVSFLIGALIERVLIRPFSTTDSHLAVIIMTLGLMLVINSAVGMIWGHNARSFPTVVSDTILRIGPVTISIQSVVVIAAVSGLAIGLHLLFDRTRFGLGMRAALSNPSSARLLGLPVDRMAAVGWGLAAGVGALVGVLAAPQLFLQPNMFLSLLVYAFAAAILGGLDSPYGALIGGLVVGVSENLAGAYLTWIGTDFKQGVALVIIMGVLVARPQGMFGARQVARV